MMNVKIVKKRYPLQSVVADFTFDDNEKEIKIFTCTTYVQHGVSNNYRDDERSVIGNRIDDMMFGKVTKGERR